MQKEDFAVFVVDAKKFAPWITLVLAVISSCTKAVAPEGVPASKSRQAAMEQRLSTATNANATPSPTPTDTAPPANDQVTIPTGNRLGTIASQEGDLFTAVSAYGTYYPSGTYKSLVITVTENDVSDLVFKKITSWECYSCTGYDSATGTTSDPRCVTPVMTDGSYTLTFTTPVGQSEDGIVAAANAEGFPNKNEIKLRGDPSDDQYFNPGFTLSLLSAKTLTGHTGTIKFTTIPTSTVQSATSETAAQFGLEIDLTFKNGKKHKTTLSGKVYETVTGSTEKPASCTTANGRFAVPTYESE